MNGRGGGGRHERLWVIAGCVLGLVVASAVGASAEPIKIGYPIWVGFGPIYLAHSKGFFKAQGVDVDLQVIDDTKVGMAALAAKRIEAYGATPEHRPALRQGRQPVRHGHDARRLQGR